MWDLDIKKAEHWRIDAFELWCWRRLLRVPWTTRRSIQSILKEISRVFIGRTDAEAETPILWPPDAKNWLIWKDPDAGKDWRQEEKGTTEDKMVGWHHRFNRRVWVNSVSWLWTGRPGVLQSMELQGVGHDWATELNWLNFESPLDILDTSHLLNISANNFCLWLVFPLNRVLLRTKHFYFLQV